MSYVNGVRSICANVSKSVFTTVRKKFFFCAKMPAQGATKCAEAYSLVSIRKAQCGNVTSDL